MQRKTIKLIGHGLGLIVLFILTAMPICVYLLPMSSTVRLACSLPYIYVARMHACMLSKKGRNQNPMHADNQTRIITNVLRLQDMNQATASCQRIPIILLNRSVCSSVFPLWTSDEYRNRNISVSGCGYFTKAEEDFRFLRTLLPEIADEAEIMSLLCHFAFKDCEEYANNSESSDDGIILRLSKYLEKFSKIDIADFLSLLETHEWCLTIPKGDRGDLRCKQENISEAGICHKPLLPTLAKNAQERCLYCSPPCHEQPWKTGATIFSASLRVSVAIYGICIVVVFVTWAKAANPYAKI